MSNIANVVKIGRSIQGRRGFASQHICSLLDEALWICSSEYPLAKESKAGSQYGNEKRPNGNSNTNPSDQAP